MFNGCDLTVIEAESNDVEYQVGKEPSVFEISVSDSVSGLAGVSYCGEYQISFWFENKEATFVSYDEQGWVVTEDIGLEGINTVVMKVGLADYPLVPEVEVDFYVQITVPEAIFNSPTYPYFEEKGLLFNHKVLVGDLIWHYDLPIALF